jgi:hypothetical protein
MIIMGIDPGETTGWAVLEDGRVGGGGLAALSLEDYGQLNGGELLAGGMHLDGLGEGGLYDADRAICMSLAILINEYEPDIVCVEDFILRPSGIGSTARSGLSPLRIIAMMEMWRFEIGFNFDALPHGGDDGMTWSPRWYYQQPSDAKGVVTDARLRAAGLWVKGQQHARDAIRHACLGFRKEAGRK